MRDKPPHRQGQCPDGGKIMKATFANQLINIAAAALVGATVLLAAGTGAAQASNKIVAKVSISRQTMQVLVDGRPTFE